MSSNTIEINNYTKILKGKTVLSHINLTLEQGKTYGLFGHNGSGKTMLLRAVAGLIVPTEGTVTVFGETLGESVSFPSSMGLIIENIGFWPYYTGFDNLKIMASIRKKITDEEIRQAIRRVGLDPDDKRTYKKYSLGMKQRLGIAQVIMEKPDLILLDEPTNGLDEEGVEQFRRIIREEQERGATIILASHIKEELSLLCHKRYQMEDGLLKEVVSS